MKPRLGALTLPLLAALLLVLVVSASARPGLSFNATPVHAAAMLNSGAAQADKLVDIFSDKRSAGCTSGNWAGLCAEDNRWAALPGQDRFGEEENHSASNV